ncbi:cysteine hydrolase family protein [Deinococcus sp. Marseille-Q6407]|uniref:cysteine hydrolase family protein n=1 Tax=Deinococcus sp. Marseille-Q6407 TaxID=2969223 RepID=UPI0021BF354C|nr:isochorismatase family cysteine hydrolase [Deinococcus sp. Marseille-Q6407]
MSQPVLSHLEEVGHWLTQRPVLGVSAEQLSSVAVLAVDIINGFTREGALASPRVENIIAPSVSLIQGALDAGLPAAHVGLMADAHPENAEEFRAYPPHCAQGTHEAEWAPELLALPAAGKFSYFYKNSIASHHTPELERWLEQTAPRTLIVIGDVTDLCLYSLGLHLLTRSQHSGLGQRIVLPANCAQTWDAPDHPAELYHPLFLYQLARTGAEVVSGVNWLGAQA